jgi:protein-L-isoaspartate O-methyltransferase
MINCGLVLAAMRNYIMLILLAFSTMALAQDPAEKTEKLAPYFPTPNLIVERMLKLGDAKKGEQVFDLGSGDGRIVIMAARKFGANATGVEFAEDLAKQSEDRIRDLGLEKKAHIIHGDLLKQNYSSADLITVYLLPVSTDKVRPMLERQLKKGARVVAHDFEITGWTPEKTESIDDDGEGRSHTLFLYRR